MATARFELDGLTVEGFKAFSIRQDVSFAGKHCFLFGANNLGKSSIIEAIRWCLFGSEPGSSVRNRFHEGSDCRVELRLRDEAGLWRLERRMRPGDQDTSLDTNLTIRNPDGERVASKETLLPNLARLGTRAGALVLFSAQQETRSRAYGDLSRFQEVLYAHLGLTEAERFCDQLSALLEEQTEIERKRSEALEEAKRELGERLTRAETDLAAAVRTPPWELSEAPTRSASTTRIQAFVSDLAHELAADPSSAAAPIEALAEAEKWVRDSSSTRKEALDHSAAVAKEEYDHLSARVAKIRFERQREEAARVRADTLTKQLRVMSSHEELAEIEERLETASARLNHAMLATKARNTLVPILGSDVRSCPICGTVCDGVKLAGKVANDIEHAIPAEARATQQVENLEKAKALKEQRDAALDEERAAHQESDREVTQLASELACAADKWEMAAESRSAELQQRSGGLQQQSEGVAGYITRQLSRIAALRSEWTYHHLRDEVQRLRSELQDGLQPARDHLRDLEGLRSTTHDLLEAVREEFDAVVTASLPSVGDQLTEAYRRLTGHPAFDILRIERTEGPDKLAIRVGSTRAPAPWSRPEDVLNQGAYTALGLVPHLVFSGFHAEQAELNVLMVDDPAQSFDTSHVELLIDELRRASERAQLVLATHEEDRFRPIIERCFPVGSFKIIRVTDFQIDRGPTIEQT